MTDVKQYLKLLDFAENNGAKSTKSVKKEEIGLLIDDILFDLSDSGKIITKRLYSVASDIFGIDDKSAKSTLDAFSSWLIKNKQVTEGLDILLEELKVFGSSVKSPMNEIHDIKLIFEKRTIIDLMHETKSAEAKFKHKIEQVSPYQIKSFINRYAVESKKILHFATSDNEQVTIGYNKDKQPLKAEWMYYPDKSTLFANITAKDFFDIAL